VEEGALWWLQFLRLFALNTPFGMPVKFTIGVTAYDGERLWEPSKIRNARS
jgi:hypothetical protein